MPACDACEEVFQPELLDEDEEFDLEEQLEEEGWIDDEDGTFCSEHKTYHPDHAQIDYGRNILE